MNPSSKVTPRRRQRLIAAVAAALLGLCGFASAASAEVEIYVAPGGNDAGPGTLAEPFATLQRAQAAVRAATPGMSADVVVNLRGGTYRVASPLALSDAAGDSGQNGHRVVWQAYGYGTPAREHPVLSGGRAVGGWTLVDPSRKIWRADVGNLANRQLYRGGKRLRQGSIARIPGKVTRTAAGFLTSSEEPLSWADPASIELVFSQVGYSQGICGVADIRRAEGKTLIEMDQPCFRWLRTVYTYNEADPEKPETLVAPHPLENSRSFLAAAGQWSIDRSTPDHHYLYYRAAAGEDPNQESFVAPAKQTLVTGSGTEAAPLHDVSFKGIAFEDSTWTAPNSGKGMVQIFGDYYYRGGSPSGSLTEPTTRIPVLPGALDFHFAHDLLFEGDRFVHLGADAVKIEGTAGNVFRGNVFAASAGGAIKLNGLNDGSDVGNLVEDNWVHSVGADYQGSIGIYLEDVVDSTLQHNQLEHLPYSGISQTISEAKGHGVRILDNRVADVVKVMMDGGGIYTSLPQGPSWAEGGSIEGNEVHGAINPRMERIDPNGQVGAPNGIYTDVEADFITLRRNVIYENHQSWGGVAPKRMRFNHNFWDDDQLVWYGPTKGLRIKENTLLNAADPVAACEALAACEAIRDAAGLEPQWRHLLGS